MNSIPYATQSVSEDDIAAVCEVLISEWLTQGPSVPRFELAFAQRHDCAHAVAVCNATAGLHIACLALGAGPGKMVWTSPNSFVASANAALYCGAEVDFVDIDPVTRNMSVPALEAKLQKAKESNTLPAIVIPVHFAGLPCDMAPMRMLANRYGFRLLEDASHAVGASYEGHPVGSRYADASVFSFHPVKIITTGEGGMVLTQDDVLAKRLRLLRSHGITRESADMNQPCEDIGAWHYEQHVLGFNCRMTDIHAALGFSQLQRLDGFHAARQRIADRYDSLLADMPLRLPPRVGNANSSWHLYVVEIKAGLQVADRKEVFTRLRSAGIGVNVHYIPIHTQPYYRNLGFVHGQFPHAEYYYSGAISIPIYPTLTDAQQDRVVSELRRALQT
jgi:UDP-4-amino-4,6-dideoxy-N-acetyl-beta-L-altrosamine transaminase